jgi:hypothetical protein
MMAQQPKYDQKTNDFGATSSKRAMFNPVYQRCRIKYSNADHAMTFIMSLVVWMVFMVSPIWIDIKCNRPFCHPFVRFINNPPRVVYVKTLFLVAFSDYHLWLK